MILEDDEPDTPASVDAGADSAFELSKPIDPSDHEAWYDVEAGCYVEEELPPGLEPEQEGLAASTPVHDHGHSRYHSPGPSHDRIGQYDGDGNHVILHYATEVRNGILYRSISEMAYLWDLAKLMSFPIDADQLNCTDTTNTCDKP